MWAVRRDDVWLTTYASTDPITLKPLPSTLWHWNGTSWKQATVGDVSSQFQYVWASGPNDVWVTGDRLRRWDGATWTDRTDSAMASTWAIHGRGPTDIWVGGGAAGLGPDALFHWDGVSWQDRTPPVIPADVGVFLGSTIWESAAADVWVGGTAWVPSGGGVKIGAWVLQHWDGHTWTVVQSGLDRFFHSFWGSSPTDLWAAGSGIFHFDGSSWTTAVASPNMAQVWGSCAGDVWAASNLGGTPLHYDGSSWSPDATPGFPTNNGVGALTGTSADDVWAGMSSTVAHRNVVP
jgi:hypothetical protein